MVVSGSKAKRYMLAYRSAGDFSMEYSITRQKTMGIISSRYVTHSLLLVFIHSYSLCTHSPTHSPTHSLTHSLTYSLTHSGISKSLAKGLDCIVKGEDDEAINYFVDILPRIRGRHGLGIHSH